MADPSSLGPELRADCARCQGLCCVVPAFAPSADFAIAKPAGDPCLHLGEDHRCTIHSQLRHRGFPGCAVYDCFGAGQQVCQGTFAGRRWRDDAEVAKRMFAAFEVMRGVHEILVYLRDGLDRAAAAPMHAELEALYQQVLAVSGADEPTVLAADVDALRAQASPLLHRVSRLVRAAFAGAGDGAVGVDGVVEDLAGVDRAGADLRRAGLAGACLRGALLIGADLGGADLRCADLLGADLRGARLEGADLGEALFLTTPQVNSARGDARTRLPAAVHRPVHWS